MRQIRRCVIGTDTEGQSYTQFDHDAPIGMALGKTGAVGLLWKTSEIPVNHHDDEDQANVPFQPMPVPSGTVFGFTIFPVLATCAVSRTMRSPMQLART